MTSEANENDPRVSGAYRDLATESTRPELDDKVLAMAAQHARTRYGLARAWVRPIAWAATIGLSFAFILEMSEYTNTPARDAATRPAAARPTADRPAAAPPATDLVVERPRSAPASAIEKAPEPQQDLAEDDFSDLREAEELMREAPARARLSSSYAEKKEAASHCDAEARTSAESWYECILALREDGRSDAAAEELKALRAEYPDFRAAEPDK